MSFEYCISETALNPKLNHVALYNNYIITDLYKYFLAASGIVTYIVHVNIWIFTTMVTYKRIQ